MMADELEPIFYTDIDKMAQHVIERGTKIQGGYRHSKFFVKVGNAEKYVDHLRNQGVKDICLVLAKNAEDLARGASCNARIEGAHVHWTDPLINTP